MLPGGRTRGLPRIGLALLVGLLVACGSDPESPRRPNVLLITLDTTRADFLGSYGHPGETSPHLDRLAEESVLYKEAVATSSWTLPSHASLFTGKFTASHGARYDPEGPLILTDAIAGKPGWEQIRARGLEGAQPTLATLLAGEGYDTGAVVAGPWLKRVMGLDAGFAFYDDAGIESVNGRLAKGVTDAALAWLAQPRERPFFLFLNYFDPHAPFSPPREFLRLRPRGDLPEEESRRLGRYEAEIRSMDHHIGRLLDDLRRKGVYDDTWIFVTADHGEALGEHGTRGHGATLYQEVIHIPLFVKHPKGGASPAVREGRVQLVDILPTIVEGIGAQVPPGVQGTPLDRVDHPIVAQVHPLTKAGTRDVRAYVEDGYKLVWRGDGHRELYHLAEDPDELRDLAAKEPDRVVALEAALDAYLASLPAPPAPGAPREVDAETREALEALGYLE